MQFRFLLSLPGKFNTVRQMRRNSDGAFTLIEVLVVVAIVAILASLAYPVYTSALERARITQDMNNLRQIGIATQLYLNDNDGVLFSAATGADPWQKQLHPKYLSSWNIFKSPFDNPVSPRTTLDDDTNSAVSYGLNGGPTGSSIAGLSVSKIANASAFIIFAPAQASGAIVSFQGAAGTASPGVTVYQATSNPGGTATGGTQNSRQKINALFADLHIESMLWGPTTLWSAFISDLPAPGSKCPSGSDATVSSHWHPDPCNP